MAYEDCCNDTDFESTIYVHLAYNFSRTGFDKV